jgi:hypothetical protein
MRARFPAVLMGSVTVLTALLTQIVLILMFHPVPANFLQRIILLSQSASARPWSAVLLLGLLLVVVFVGGFMISSLIYYLDQTHYGRAGALRWSLVGSSWAVLVQLGESGLAALGLADPGDFVRGLLMILWASCAYLLGFYVLPRRPHTGVYRKRG